MTVAETHEMPIVQTLWSRKNEEESAAETTAPLPALRLAGTNVEVPARPVYAPRPPRVKLIKVPGSRALPNPSPAEQAVSAEALVQVQPEEKAPLPVRPVGQSLRDTPVGGEETIGSPTTVAAELQQKNPHLIIWYGEHTKEYWVLSDALRSYQTYSALIQSLS